MNKAILDKTTKTRRAGIARLDAAWSEDPKTGYMDLTMYSAVPGVLVYRYKDKNTGQVKTVRELVTHEVLHDAAVRASLESKPILNEHRYKPNGEGLEITEDNAKGEISGWTKGEHRVSNDGKRTEIDGVIIDPILKNLIKSGKHQVSPGYDSYTRQEPGTHPEFGPYDEIQVYRDYNHIAFTHKGRAGEPVSIKLDSDTDTLIKYNVDAWEIDPDDADETIKENEPKMKDKNEGVENKAPSFKTDSEQIVHLSKQLGAVEIENAELKGQIKALNTDLEKAKAFNVDSSISEAAAQKALLVDQALSHLPEGTDRGSLYSMKDLEIKRAVVKANYDSETFEDSEIEGAYKVAIKSPKQAQETQNTNAGVAIKQSFDAADKSDDSIDPIGAAYARSIEKMQEGND